MFWDKSISDLIWHLVPMLSSMVAYFLIIIAYYMLDQANNLEFEVALTNVEKMIDNNFEPSNTNGKLTEAQFMFIKDKALVSLRNEVSCADMKILERRFGEVDKLIVNILEKKIADNKLKTTIVKRRYLSS